MPYETRILYIPPYNEYEIERRPIMAGHYGEMPQAFIASLKERTGFKNYELQDYLDLLIVDIFTGWDFAGFIKMNYEIVAAAQRKISRFRTYLAIFMGACIVLPSIIVAVQAAVAATTTCTSMALSIFGKIKLFAEVFVGSLMLDFNAMLAAIHFQTLIGVHKIALLVSDDYRLVMSRVYDEIRNVSSALGYGPEFLLLLTQNSKKLIQDVGSTFGREWDLTEVQWLSTFQDYLGKFQGAAYKYRDDPEKVLFDLARWVEEPAVNAKGAFMGKLIENVDGVIEKTEEIVGNIVTVRNSIDDLVKDLPEKISKQIDEAIGPYVEKFDTFIYDVYDPQKEELDNIMDTFRGIQDALGFRTVDIVDRLKKPADYLLEIDNLSDEDRLDQEFKFDDLSSRYYKGELTASSKGMEPISAELRKIRDILTRPLELAFMGVEEVTAPVPIPIGEIDPSKTWFVGDY